MSAARRRAPYDDRGWLLLDSVIGALILTLGLLATTLVFNESSRSMTQVTAQQSAVTLATSLLSVATSYGCGAETGLSLPGPALAASGTDYPATQNLWDECAALYAGQSTAPYPGELGDPVDTNAGAGGAAPSAWSVSIGGMAFEVSYQAIWLQRADDTSGCPGTLVGGASAIDPIATRKMMDRTRR